MNKKLNIIITILITFIFSLIGCSQINSNKHNSNNMIVHYIDVGQGDSILIQVNKKNLLIDSGPKEGRDSILTYLELLGIQKLDYVIATHPHEDHIGNMAKIIKKYNVGAFYAPRVESTTSTFEKMIQALKDKNLKINILKKGTNSIDLGKNTHITIFSPNKTSYENLNNYSPVIKIEYGNTSFLFTGDAEKDIENEILLNSTNNIKSDVIKVGHHGSSTSTTKSFINKVNPSIAIISVGDDNSYNHPNKDVLKRLKENATTIYQTNKEGTIIISSDGINIRKDNL